LKPNFFERDMAAERKALAEAKAFCARVAKKKKLYTVHQNGMCTTTMRYWAEEYQRLCDDVPVVDLDRVRSLVQEGKSAKEIAETLGVPVRSLKSICGFHRIYLIT